jgi:transposase
MLKPRSPQASFYGSYLYDKIVPADHPLRQINHVVDFSFIQELVQDQYSADFGRPAEDPEFMLRLCLLQYIYGDSDREVVATARLNLAYNLNSRAIIPMLVGLPRDRHRGLFVFA